MPRRPQPAARAKRAAKAGGTVDSSETSVVAGTQLAEGTTDPREPLALLFRDLRTSEFGLSDREAQRRLVVYGPNDLARRTGRRWPRELLNQFTHPLALLLVVAAILAWLGGTPVLTAAIAAVIVLNAAFAFVQEIQAERAVEALAAYLPSHTRVLRNRVPCQNPGLCL